jgi:Ca2+-binding EF-hand superfamily protein
MTPKQIALGGTFALFAAAAYAAAPEPHEQVRAFDRDGDGVFSDAEIDQAAEQLFTRADADRDGRLAVEEMRALHPEGAGHGETREHHGGSMANLTLAGFRTHMRERLSRADANRDGQISVAEIEAMHRSHGRHSADR